MESGYHSVLEELIKDLENELNKVKEEIEYHNRAIKEAECYINSFKESEPLEFKFFSPRNAESIYKEEIEKTSLECAEYEEQNIKLTHRRDRLSQQLDQLIYLRQYTDYGLDFIEMQEQERQRIARDLHDTSLQNLTHLIHRIEISSLYIDNDPIKAKLELSVVSKILKDTIEEIRNTIFNLRPMNFDDLGMKETIELLLNKINENGEYEIETEIDCVSCENNITLVSIYRVIEECINNIVKHAKADKIIIRFKYVDQKYVIDIIDNGQGFQLKSVEKSKNHFGLHLIKERVELLQGIVQIKTRKNKGTSIHIEVPIKNKE